MAGAILGQDPNGNLITIRVDADGNLLLAAGGVVLASESATYNYNKSAALTNNVVKKVVFKTAGAVASQAKRYDLRVVGGAGYAGKVHIRVFTAASGAATVTNEHFFLYSDESRLSIPCNISEIHLLSIDGGAVGATFYLDAYSDEDITGTTIA